MARPAGAAADIGAFEFDSDSVTLSLTISPNLIVEGGGTTAATGTVTRDGDLTGSLIVTLASSDTSQATVPESVTLAAGQASATFTISAVDDGVADGFQQSNRFPQREIARARVAVILIVKSRSRAPKTIVRTPDKMFLLLRT